MTETPARPGFRVAFLLPVILFLALAGYFAWALLSGRDPQRVESALIGKPAPEFALPPLLPDLPGAARADFGGKPVLVNFFSSWCIPCRIEHPYLMELTKNADVTIIGIAYKDKPEAATTLLQEMGNPYDRIGQGQVVAGARFGRVLGQRGLERRQRRFLHLPRRRHHLRLAIGRLHRRTVGAVVDR